jgi:hypothetical protein
MNQASFNRSTAADPFALTSRDYERFLQSTIPPEIADKPGFFGLTM